MRARERRSSVPRAAWPNLDSMVFDTVKNWFGVESVMRQNPIIGERAATIVGEAIENEDPERFLQSTRGELVGFGMGVKPAVYLNGFTLGDPRTVRDRFLQEGAEISCGREIIVNEQAILERVRNEPVLARTVGWNAAQTALEQFQESMRFENRDRDNMRIGFILGIPGTAIRGFDKERKIKDAKGNVLPSQLFRFSTREPIDPAWEAWLLGMEEADRESLRTMAEEFDMISLYESSVDPLEADRLEAEACDQFFTKRGDAIQRIYRQYTTVTEEEASLFMSRRRKSICAPDGSEVYVFITHGPEGRNAPDVRRLEAQVRDAFQREQAKSAQKAAAYYSSSYDSRI